ncbi:flavin reductase family protein [Shewanella waksmanii]|uniref:flavin reductase family protein n=1 Tax=Shewanella waksmanii TaxID=213783 RepID=UPI00048B9EFA|nr:flavin reductase [Shewanella waksmanii]
MNKHFTQADFEAMEQRYRARFINSLSGFKSANLVGSIDSSGNSNLAIVSSVFHIGADPALMGMIIRPDSVPRDTLTNIKATQCYTLNQVNSANFRRAHQTSARYLSSVSEFTQVGLTEQFIAGFTAPFVAESELKVALAVREISPLSLNDTLLVIGEVQHVIVPDCALKQDGYIDIEALEAVAVTGLDSYHRGQRLARLSYAKPDTLPIHLSVAGESEFESD